MDAFTDPERLRRDDGVTFEESSHVVAPDEFASARDGLESHVVVGVCNGSGDVLLMDDGAHGWTLASFPVERGDEWTAVARGGLRELTGVDIGLDCLERVRRTEFENEQTGEKTAIYTAILRAATVDGRPVADDPMVGGESLRGLGWFDVVPEGCTGPVAGDIRLFLG